MAVSISLQLFVPLYKIQQYFIFAKTMASEILKIEIQNLLESTGRSGMDKVIAMLGDKRQPVAALQKKHARF